MELQYVTSPAPFPGSQIFRLIDGILATPMAVSQHFAVAGRFILNHDRKRCGSPGREFSVEKVELILPEIDYIYCEVVVGGVSSPAAVSCYPQPRHCTQNSPEYA